MASGGYSLNADGSKTPHPKIAPIDGKVPYTLNGHLVYEPDNSGVTYNYYTRQPFNAATGKEIPVSGPTGPTERENPNGVKQKGRDLSALNLTLLDGIADFNGPSFPTESKTNKITDQFAGSEENGAGPEALAEESPQKGPDKAQALLKKAIDSVKPGSSASSVQLPETEGSLYNPEGGIVPDQDILKAQGAGLLDDLPAGADDAALLKHLQGKNFQGSGGQKTESASIRRDIRDRDSDARGAFDPRFDRKSEITESGESEATPGVISNQEAARRRAFLDAPNARAGMKAVKAGLGLQEVGQDNYANVGGELVQIDYRDKSKLLNTAQSKVDQFRKEWAAANLPSSSKETRENPTATDAKTPPTPATAQEPTEITETPVKTPGIPVKKKDEGLNL